jgi:hypothetical protein
LTNDDIGSLLDVLGVNHPNGKGVAATKAMRIGKKVVRGYLKSDLLAFAMKADIKGL